MSDTAGPPRRILWGAGTPRTMRAHWMLNELDLAYESRPIGPRTGETQTAEFTRLNPSQKVPVLQDGEFTLSESAAIVTYLAETYGTDRHLVPPAGTRDRACYDQWCFFIMMELDANTLYVIRRHDDLKNLYGEAPNALTAAREAFRKQIRVAEQALASGGPFILGGNFTGADILLSTCLGSAIRRQIDLPGTLPEYLRRITLREGYQLALRANHPK